MNTNLLLHLRVNIWLLRYLDDDGQKVEPRYYVPIIPMVLVNGIQGIGTGWSTSIPPHHPLELIKVLKSMLAGKEPLSGGETHQYPICCSNIYILNVSHIWTKTKEPFFVD
jgi:hypothetical protein